MMKMKFVMLFTLSMFFVHGATFAEETPAAPQDLIQETDLALEDTSEATAPAAEQALEEPSALPETAKIPEESQEALDEAIGEQIHEVVPGDTLYDIAIKYKTTVDNLKTANGLKKDVIFPGMKLKVFQGSFEIQVDKSDNSLKLYFNEKLVKEYSVSTGKDSSTPAGEFKIINKIENPTWYKAGAIVPPDSPDNILGPRWLGFDKPGYGIHGTTMPETIGEQASAGCVRMNNDDVEDLFSIVPIGTKVIVTE